MNDEGALSGGGEIDHLHRCNICVCITRSEAAVLLLRAIRGRSRKYTTGDAFHKQSAPAF